MKIGPSGLALRTQGTEGRSGMAGEWGPSGQAHPPVMTFLGVASICRPVQQMGTLQPVVTWPA